MTAADAELAGLSAAVEYTVLDYYWMLEYRVAA